MTAWSPSSASAARAPSSKSALGPLRLPRPPRGAPLQRAPSQGAEAARRRVPTGGHRASARRPGAPPGGGGPPLPAPLGQAGVTQKKLTLKKKEHTFNIKTKATIRKENQKRAENVTRSFERRERVNEGPIAPPKKNSTHTIHPIDGSPTANWGSNSRADTELPNWGRRPPPNEFGAGEISVAKRSVFNKKIKTKKNTANMGYDDGASGSDGC